MSSAQLTMLSSMAAQDFHESLETHKKWGLHWLDLRDGIYGHWIKDLDVETAKRAKADIDAAGLEVYCISTSIFFDDIEKGEENFRENHLAKVSHAIELARVFQPKVLRVIAAQLPSRGENESAMDLIEEKYPWVIKVYQEAIDQISGAGFTPTIENEAFRCFLSRVEDFGRFFEALDRKGTVALTWDVQNHWATGVFPTTEVYEQLKPLIHYYHVKGGQNDGTPERKLKWNVALEDADWPVAELTQKVVDDGVSPVICLNPAQHGEQKPDYNYEGIVKRDVDFLRHAVKGVE
jgi:hypothetical protein